MFNEELEIYHNGKKSISTISNLTKNQKVLFCSLVKPFELASIHYARYLLELERNLGDTILYIVSPKPIARATIEGCLYPEELENFKFLLDRNLVIHKWLSSVYDKQKPMHWLRRYWLYTTLVENNEILFFNEQPTENQKEHIVKNMSKGHIKDIVNNKKIETFKAIMQLPEDLIFGQESVDQFDRDYDHSVIKSVYYHNLWPNLSLDKYLRSAL